MLKDSDIQKIVRKANKECEEQFLQDNLILSEIMPIKGVSTEQEIIYAYAFNTMLAYLKLLDLEQEAIDRRDRWNEKLTQFNRYLTELRDEQEKRLGSKKGGLILP